MPGNLAPTILRLARDTISIRRASANTVDSHGRVSAPSFSTTSGVRASVQPASGEDLERTPQGTHSHDVQAVYTAVPLYTANDVLGTVADQITTATGTYQVEHVEVWQNNGLFWRSVVRRVNS